MNLQIPNTSDVISHCWTEAENIVLHDSAEALADASEETITSTFYQKFYAALKAGSDAGEIAKAIYKDLANTSIWGLSTENCRDLSKDFVAEVAVFDLHRRYTEGKTGGDFGLVLSRPDISQLGSTIQFKQHRQGLLCQAKLKDIDGYWSGLGGNQEILLADRTSYLALVLYQFKNNRRNLSPFQWKSCLGFSIPEIQKWFRDDIFSDLKTSPEIVGGLASGRIGTNDNGTINTVIAPSGNPSVHVRIFRDGEKPGSEVIVRVRGDIENIQNVNSI